ncbi:unnamed protein product [Protopolystoma xenopodis]|uniref:Strictosidine synthase conserved region domain-containing protein n=1 Tax=Protopolystoma xenopodis TaxID=117903 RepID=A0A3S5BUG9_9PLAT|nr:unnamed protein product [Protopolystoma xenopodis]
MLGVRKHAMVVRLDPSGRIVESLHDTSGHIFSLSEASEHDGYLYLASYVNQFVARIPLTSLSDDE